MRTVETQAELLDLANRYHRIMDFTAAHLAIALYVLLVGRWHKTEPPAVNDDHIAVTIGPCAACEIQDGTTHFFGSTDSLRREYLFWEDSIADKTGGHFGWEDCWTTVSQRS